MVIITTYFMREKKKKRERKPSFRWKEEPRSTENSTKCQINQNEILKIGNMEQEISVFT